jgi:hypothetical protein
MTELEREKNYYDEIKNKIEVLDEDLKKEYNKEFEYWNDYHDEHVKFCVLINNISKYVCVQKFRHCENKCKRAKENIFHCEFCENIDNAH